MVVCPKESGHAGVERQIGHGSLCLEGGQGTTQESSGLNHYQLHLLQVVGDVSKNCLQDIHLVASRAWRFSMRINDSSMRSKVMALAVRTLVRGRNGVVNKVGCI